MLAWLLLNHHHYVSYAEVIANDGCSDTPIIAEFKAYLATSAIVSDSCPYEYWNSHKEE